MSDPSKSANAKPDLLSRRQAIVGALALAAGTLVATKPETALAANGDTVRAAGFVYANAGSTLYLTSDGTPGGTEVAQAMINRDGGAFPAVKVQAFGGIVMPSAVAGSSGVMGFAWSSAHYGVLAEHGSPAGVALKVEGKSQFSRSGKATISKGHASRTVTGLNNITTDSIILVTLQGSAGTGNHVRWAKRLSSTSFQVVLTKAAAVNVTFGWMILN